MAVPEQLHTSLLEFTDILVSDMACARPTIPLIQTQTNETRREEKI